MITLDILVLEYWIQIVDNYLHLNINLKLLRQYNNHNNTFEELCGVKEQ